MPLDNDKVKKFFCIAFKIKNNHLEFGVSKELVFKYIEQEFNLMSQRPLERIFNEMIMAEFIFVGMNGIKANANLEKEHQKFLNHFRELGHL